MDSLNPSFRPAIQTSIVGQVRKWNVLRVTVPAGQTASIGSSYVYARQLVFLPPSPSGSGVTAGPDKDSADVVQLDPSGFALGFGEKDSFDVDGWYLTNPSGSDVTVNVLWI